MCESISAVSVYSALVYISVVCAHLPGDNAGGQLHCTNKTFITIHWYPLSATHARTRARTHMRAHTHTHTHNIHKNTNTPNIKQYFMLVEMLFSPPLTKHMPLPNQQVSILSCKPVDVTLTIGNSTKTWCYSSYTGDRTQSLCTH